MALTSKQLKAIAWYQKEHSYRLTLSSIPTIYFKDTHNKTIPVNITELTKQYDTWNEEDKRTRARERAQGR